MFLSFRFDAQPFLVQNWLLFLSACVGFLQVHDLSSKWFTRKLQYRLLISGICNKWYGLLEQQIIYLFHAFWLIVFICCWRQAQRMNGEYATIKHSGPTLNETGIVMFQRQHFENLLHPLTQTIILDSRATCSLPLLHFNIALPVPLVHNTTSRQAHCAARTTYNIPASCAAPPPPHSPLPMSQCKLQ